MNAIKETMLGIMVKLMPFMQIILWIGVIASIVALLLLLLKYFNKANFSNDYNQSIAITYKVAIFIAYLIAVFFIVAQVLGMFLGLKPSIDFGDPANFDFGPDFSFIQIGGMLLILTVIIYLFGKIKVFK